MADPRPTERARRATALGSWRARASEAIRFHPREVVALVVLAVLLVIGGVIAYMRARPVAAAPLAPLITASVSPSGATQIWVDVAGAVRHPGVYRFPEGTRVFDAIEAAGGFARGAQTQAINRARVLNDGEQIVVPREGEAVPASGGGGGNGGASGGKVNINAADASGFEDLPGIGPVLAQRIVEYRTQHGPFRTIQDLMKVPGIGQKKFDSLKDHVTV